MQIDHVAILVQPGALWSAVHLFTHWLKPKWKEDSAARVIGDWGEARFVCPPGGTTRLQLTALADYWPVLPTVFPGFHVGIAVEDPERTSQELLMFAKAASMKASREEIPGGKWFVELPELLAGSLEFVPAQQR